VRPARVRGPARPAGRPHARMGRGRPGRGRPAGTRPRGVTVGEQPTADRRPPGRRRRLLTRAAVALVVILAIALGAFLWWAQPQPLLPEATAALASTPAASFSEGQDGRLTFVATAVAPHVGLVLYTGGKVPPAAYAPAARAIAEAGYLVGIVPAPLNFAIFDTGAAEGVIADHPEITSWAVGGHSLGGASAALFIDGH